MKYLVLLLVAFSFAVMLGGCGGGVMSYPPLQEDLVKPNETIQPVCPTPASQPKCN